MTSCSKESLISPTKSTVSVRTETMEISGTVASFEVIIEDVIVHLVNTDNDPEGLTPVTNQVLKFHDASQDGAVIDVPVTVSSFEVIIEDIIVHFVAPTNLDNLTIAENQTLVFN